MCIESSNQIKNIHIAKGVARTKHLQAIVAKLSDKPSVIPANTIIVYATGLSKDWYEPEDMKLLDLNLFIDDSNTTNTHYSHINTSAQTLTTTTNNVNDLLKLLDFNKDRLAENEIKNLTN